MLQEAVLWWPRRKTRVLTTVSPTDPFLCWYQHCRSINQIHFQTFFEFHFLNNIWHFCACILFYSPVLTEISFLLVALAKILLQPMALHWYIPVLAAITLSIISFLIHGFVPLSCMYWVSFCVIKWSFLFHDQINSVQFVLSAVQVMLSRAPILTAFPRMVSVCASSLTVIIGGIIELSN